MEGPIESFRLSFWWLLGYVTVGVGALGLPAVAITLWVVPILEGRRLELNVAIVAVGIAVAVAEVLVLVAVFLGTRHTVVSIGPTGLRLPTFTFWGRHREVAWADVLKVRSENLLGQRSLRITTTGTRIDLRVPLFLHRLDRFHELVLQYPGPEHPLAVALAEEPPGALLP